MIWDFVRLQILIFILPFFAFAEGKFQYEYTENCNIAYQNFMSLHFDEAKIALDREKKENPTNLMTAFLSDYEDYLVLMINCDKKEYTKRKVNLDARIELLDKGDRTSPWYRFCKAGVYMHWALINLRFSEQFAAAITFRKSFLLVKDNTKMFPKFEYNLIFSGLEESVVGSLPDNYKWLAFLLGLKGDVKKGVEKLSLFVAAHNDNQPLKLETNIYTLYIKFYLYGQQREIWSYMESPAFSLKDNLLHVFVKAYLGLDYKKGGTVLKILQDAQVNQHFYEYPYFNFQMGVANLCNLDSTFINNFQNYLATNKSDFHIKDVWQRMALYYYYVGDLSKAEMCRKAIKTNGKTLIDADKHADKFAETTNWPDKRLWAAKMLIDGGYETKAYNLLYTIDPNLLKNPAEKAEYYFRLGQVYNASTDYKKAFEYFDYTIQVGKERHEQYAARAALQEGKIYEAIGKKQEAIASYKQALNMPSHDFQNSIDQQAKAGIDRLEEK